ncbi:FAD-linked oxidase C-terminal domain-containing protein [Xanthomonas campestris pv. campestris]|uniref:FAD-binding oxidoreductase n=1 Tax=Xanthomonas campestris TaxID=339 RepID=UPI0023791C26|nr:FAD-linked oxidase C-terminal domain-containing protein [Xanthomonas campestris]MDO0862218.1 FAD-binding protein [Xanthomonas campestris pv. campestris]MEB1201689.1 FAD-linked oxidase C-terminal domain-containing protein [Xanthomonas campestris pv. campestris]MEB1238082.1 FAD-linked oxidase C-terminal domain-containing protein [Xanthomonas campestris pv. campestris]MEB1483501.1 FAD-linked oxidase C-terminal domain-containing protein [Xanthomonas campestris pv. campestris]MEB1503072.1 FAD-li
MTDGLPTALADLLAARLGPEGWLTGADARRRYGEDDSRRWALPGAVALPRDTDAVVAIVQACRAHGVPIVARGAGTGTTGAAVPFSGGVVVSMARMNRILALRPADRCAVVQPGVLNGDLQQALQPHGLFWPPDPSSAEICSVGGNLSTNAGGPRAVKYGATRDNVLGLVAVTGTGDVIHCGGAYTKNSTGYDLTHLLVGSEGTLAIIVEATLKLTPRAVAQAGVRALYRDAASAAAAVSRIMAQPTTPTMLEFMDASAIALLRRNGSDVPDAGAMLLIEADGDHDTLPYALQALHDAADGDGVLSLDIAADGSARDKLWAARRALSPALRTIKPGKINEDVVVPVSRIPELVAGVEALAVEFAVPIVAFGHAGNGNLHVNIMYDPDDADETARAQAALPRVFALVLALEGTLSGEHGIGVAKRDFMTQAFSAPTLAAMRAIKAALDPDGILNPGKVLPTSPAE